jgi:hypothetical protein
MTQATERDRDHRVTAGVVLDCVYPPSSGPSELRIAGEAEAVVGVAEIGW